MTARANVAVPDQAEDDAAYFQGIRSGMPEESQRVMEGLGKVGSVYVESGRDKALLTGFNRFLERYLATRHLPRKEADCFFLLGESGAGKSAAIDRLLRNHDGLRPVQKSYGLVQRFVSVKLKGYAPPRLVGRQIVRAAGYGLDAETGRGEIWDQMAGHLKAQRVFLVHIDEAQHLIKKNASQAERDDLADAIKGVSIDTAWPVVFVFSGLPVILKLPVGDEQFERRGNVIEFPNVDIKHDRHLVTNIIAEMCKPVGIKADHLSDTELPQRLVHATRGRYAWMCQLVEGAIQEALHWEKPLLSLGHFAVAYERRSLAFGRDDKNPFVEQYWKSLLPGSFLTVEDEKAKSS